MCRAVGKSICKILCIACKLRAQGQLRFGAVPNPRMAVRERIPTSRRSAVSGGRGSAVAGGKRKRHCSYHERLRDCDGG
jgi:hypothetical protein